ncbi:MAG: GxxExxY protein [Ignavibacteriales bacterium]|jgi:GxxExxY protein|nr:MAG: GxxExxY protein [Ignavibacterium sp.]MBL1153368.1 GxxExxY protein [Ignavibacteriota bacterium]MCZ2269663.1 GxxExxY protein [Ignavibacteriales bacterium]MDX9712533.1 GxxExxY protein [Ignavibacteriaceae bacterium]MDD5609464.1 GxxExxY protein [Ignavibacterium sp.]
MLHENITKKIIEAYYKVYNSLGYGFLEKVYENALKIELKRANLKVDQQKNVKVFYNEFEVGDYFADLIVEDLVIVELKAAESLCEEHEAQLINYLKATNLEVGLLLNFGKKAEFKRKVFSNDRKSV